MLALGGNWWRLLELQNQQEWLLPVWLNVRRQSQSESHQKTGFARASEGCQECTLIDDLLALCFYDTIQAGNMNALLLLTNLIRTIGPPSNMKRTRYLRYLSAGTTRTLLAHPFLPHLSRLPRCLKQARRHQPKPLNFIRKKKQKTFPTNSTDYIVEVVGK